MVMPLGLFRLKGMDLLRNLVVIRAVLDGNSFTLLVRFDHVTLRYEDVQKMTVVTYGLAMRMKS